MERLYDTARPELLLRLRKKWRDRKAEAEAAGDELLVVLLTSQIRRANAALKRFGIADYGFEVDGNGTGG